MCACPLCGHKTVQRIPSFPPAVGKGRVKVSLDFYWLLRPARVYEPLIQALSLHSAYQWLHPLSHGPCCSEGEPNIPGQLSREGPPHCACRSGHPCRHRSASHASKVAFSYPLKIGKDDVGRSPRNKA